MAKFFLAVLGLVALPFNVARELYGDLAAEGRETLARLRRIGGGK